MESSVTEPERTPFLEGGRLNCAAFIENAVHPADRGRVREFLLEENLKAISAFPGKLLREVEYREVGVHEGEWRRISLIHLPEDPQGRIPNFIWYFRILPMKNDSRSIPMRSGDGLQVRQRGFTPISANGI